MRRSYREDFFERVVLRLLLVRPFRCERCGHRHYDLAFRQRAPVLPQEPTEPSSVEEATMRGPSPSQELLGKVREQGLDGALNGEMGTAAPEMKMVEFIESRGPAGVTLSRLALAFKQMKKSEREGYIRGFIERQTVRCFIRQVSGRSMSVFVHKEHFEEHARRHPDDAQALWDRRRTQRVPLNVPVWVYGRTKGADPFQEETNTWLVNAHGGLITLATQVEPGQELLLTNLTTGEEQECHVARLGSKHANRIEVGVEFKRPAQRFWRNVAPSPDRKPERR